MTSLVCFSPWLAAIYRVGGWPPVAFFFCLICFINLNMTSWIIVYLHFSHLLSSLFHSGRAWVTITPLSHKTKWRLLTSAFFHERGKAAINIHSQVRRLVIAIYQPQLSAIITTSHEWTHYSRYLFFCDTMWGIKIPDVMNVVYTPFSGSCILKKL